jgi:hypothetical protein
MLEEQQLAQFKSLVENSQSVVVLVPDNADVDEVATAVAFHLTLREMGKESRLAAVAPPRFRQPELPGSEQITTELGNQNLTISFNYSEEQVDKVSYHIGEETKKFYLTIKPRSGAAPLDTSSVEFSYTGAAADLLVYVGVKSLDDLQQLYYGYEDIYQNAMSISFSKQPSSIGQFQIVLEQESSLSELLTATLSALQFPVTADTATNLLAGIEFNTKGLTQGAIEVGTFESIANLMKAGGVRVTFVPMHKQNNTNGKTELLINKNNTNGSKLTDNTSKKSKKQKSIITG